MTNFTITKITPAVRSERRVNIFVDEVYSFSLDVAQMVDFKLKVGQQLSPSELSDLKKASNFGKVYQRAIEYVLVRPRSVREVRDYLKRKQQRYVSPGAPTLTKQHYASPDSTPNLTKQQHHPSPDNTPIPTMSSQDIENIIARLLDKRYLDDKKFAEYYLANRFHQKGISQKRLQLELAKKGVDRAIIAEVISNTPRDDATEIKKIIAKKRLRYSDDQKLIQYLVRQGFSYELACNSVRETDSRN